MYHRHRYYRSKDSGGLWIVIIILFFWIWIPYRLIRAIRDEEYKYRNSNKPFVYWLLRGLLVLRLGATIYFVYQFCKN